MVDATTGYMVMSFMDGSLGYNQILMALKNEELTAFHSPKDFLANHPIPDDWELTEKLPDEDAMIIEVQPPGKMYFDGAAHCRGAGAGVTFVTSQVSGHQLLGSYEVKKPEIHPYHDYAKNLMGWIGDVTIQHVPRKENKKVDALAALASSLTLPDQAQVTVYQKWVVPPLNEAEENPRRRTEIRRRAPRFLYYKDTLYRSGHLYILATTDYFSKWAEAIAHKEVKKDSIASFIRVNIIYRFGIHRYIITDNGKPFDNRLMNKICELFGFNQRNSSIYNVAVNGLAEAFNKTLCNLLKKVVSKSKWDCHDHMEEALWSSARSFQVGDQVLAIRRPIITSHKPAGKFTSKWDGPYVVQEAYSSATYKLVDADGMRIGPINEKFLKKYYP
ncbi:uncharacterized protein [Nicotiana sylvestris]|uniref:uncharacterized protein n=1 Tax=Nicotiana sylvestris TaxID=4096 RepID=UPI00388CA21D